MINGVIYQDKNYRVKFDNKYGYYHLFPVPTRNELKKYYDEKFYNANYDKQINDSSLKVQSEEKEFIRIQYEDILETIREKTRGKKLIDIGCGYGKFLEFCQTYGYEVFGLDPSPEAIDYTKALGINAINVDFEDIKNKVNIKYDVAVMLNVFEHLRDPHTILNDIRENILKDNGLLIIKVPNEFNKLQEIANQEYNLKSWWVSVPQHVNYFSIPHLVNLINNSGFEVFLKESTFPLEIFILFGDQYVGNPVLGKAIHKKRVLFEKTIKKYDNNYKRKIYRQFAEVGLGREVTVYARKK